MKLTLFCSLFVLMTFSGFSQSIDDFIDIVSKKDTIEHGDKFNTSLILKQKYLKDTSDINISFRGRPIEVKQGRAIIIFPLAHLPNNDRDTTVLNTIDMTFKYKGTEIPFLLTYWTKPNPAYLRSIRPDFSLKNFELYPDEKPALLKSELKKELIKKFRLSNKSGHLVLTFLVSKNGRASNIEIKKNTFEGLNNEKVIQFLASQKFSPGKSGDNSVDTLDFLILEN